MVLEALIHGVEFDEFGLAFNHENNSFLVTSDRILPDKDLDPPVIALDFSKLN